jgi:molecular chaperone DnaK
LTKEDIDRMVKEAESHAKDDEKAKEKADMRNDADALIYAVEKHVADFGASNSSDNKAKAESLISELRQKIKDNVSNEALKSAIEALRAQLMTMQQEAEAKNREPVGATAGGASSGGASSGASGGASSASSSSSSSKPSSNNDDVVDAEVV